MQTLEEGVIALPTLSLWQPWASAMALGLKRNETRHWSTNFRGLFAIHAAKKWDRVLRHEYAANEAYAGVRVAYPEHPPLGFVVGVALLKDCRPTSGYRTEKGFMASVEASLGNYDPGRFAFVTEAFRRLVNPIPVVGRQQAFFPWQVRVEHLHQSLGWNIGGHALAAAPLISADGEMVGCLRCGRTTLAERAGVGLTECAFCLPRKANEPRYRSGKTRVGQVAAEIGKPPRDGAVFKRSDRRAWYVRLRHNGKVIRRSTGAMTEAGAKDGLRSWRLSLERNPELQKSEQIYEDRDLPFLPVAAKC